VPAGQRRVFSTRSTPAGAVIITDLVKPDVMVEKACTPHRAEDDSKWLPPLEVSGLSKIEAEDLLDLFEAAGYDLCQLSFVDGEGFTVRPTSLPTETPAPPART
jgi:hypothetical protein